ncbi:MAG: hypothetical protein AAGG01_22465, partial [Planctomycetota bacterium]
TSGKELGRVAPGSYTLDLHIPRLPLMPGRYPLTLWMNRASDSESIDWLAQCATMSVHAPDSSVFERTLPRRAGAIHLETTWESRAGS